MHFRIESYRNWRLPPSCQSDADSPDREEGRRKTTKAGSQGTTAAYGIAGVARYPVLLVARRYPSLFRPLCYLKTPLSHHLPSIRRNEDWNWQDGDGHSTPQERREPREGVSRPRGGPKRSCGLSNFARQDMRLGHDAVPAISGAAEPRANKVR